MLLTLLHSIALLGAAPHSAPSIAPQVPSPESSLPGAIRSADVPAQIQITSTHFQAKSLVNEPQWIVFTNSERGLVRVRGLRPFECALLPIPVSGANGMSIELIARSVDGMLLSTGTFDCAQVESATTSVFIERTKTTLAGWMPRHGGRSLTKVTTKRSLMVPAMNTSTAPAAVAAPAPHVPVPVPAENRTRDKSRQLGKKKLPVI
ncbi:hypothetical protein Poly30_45830 [Planctomycetes bacterium Poly30]|uniref:Uncharacterized protein n=2 Tax=Saltatorellus ferox TaxID=2528018 RepID=A0A518EY67_9BACT|nr:hypothetical protein Poly30_45830 [Planctomycetes bacterium Poly30]